jgi:hypothetical protein
VLDNRQEDDNHTCLIIDSITLNHKHNLGTPSNIIDTPEPLGVLLDAKKRLPCCSFSFLWVSILVDSMLVSFFGYVCLSTPLKSRGCSMPTILITSTLLTKRRPVARQRVSIINKNVNTWPSSLCTGGSQQQIIPPFLASLHRRMALEPMHADLLRASHRSFVNERTGLRQ